ncbi:hypothetical protein ERJ75_000040800 [Trypanosoma vivax]|nr:hypothetical protein ERJ75_000040800 [Trypanosoma vivax]
MQCSLVFLRRLVQSPVVADDDSVAHVRASCPSSDNMCVLERLASIVHGVFLITLADKAQLRIRQNMSLISTTLDKRWFDAVTFYCRFTVSYQDVFECCAAFPDWLSVEICRFTPRSAAVSTGEISVSHKCAVKLKLHRSSVPSFSEAERFLRERWGGKESWPAGTVCPSFTSASNDAVGGVSANAGVSASATGTVSMDITNILSDNELLSQVSAELRASLSAERLAAVLVQMRKEALGVEEKEQEEITRRQRRERLLSTFDLVRVLMPKGRSSCNAGVLVRQMVAQNRFGDDERNVIEQLAALTEFTESGISVMNVERHSVQKGRKRRRGKASSEADPPLLQLKKADLLAVSDKGNLESAVILLNHETSSRTGLHDALRRQ